MLKKTDIINNKHSNSIVTTTLPLLLAVFTLLLGLYYSLRFGGWSMEGDASSQTVAAIGMIDGGRVDSLGRYSNGFGYTAQLAFTSLLTGLNARDLQIGSSLWVIALTLVAFITYREFLGSAAAAGLGVILLFIQPDFLFYALRGSHEKYVWMYALLMLFLLARSYKYINVPSKLILFIGLFYMVFWSFTSTNVYFAAVFMGAILLSFIGGWLINRLAGKGNTMNGTRSKALQRMMIISLVCILIVFIFVQYTYWPALNTYYYFSDFSDRVSLLLLGSQPLETPASYQSFTNAWISQSAYLSLTGLQWTIVIISMIAWVIGFFRLRRMEQNQWLLWLMYSAFGFLLLFGVVADYTGFMSTNLQLRMFTPFTLFCSPLVAGLIVKGLNALRLQWRKLVSVGIVVVLIGGAVAVVLKVTNDPTLGNQWLFYTPAEIAPFSWMEGAGIQQQEVWVDTWEHLSIIYYFWSGTRPLKSEQYLYGRITTDPLYTLVSELSLMRANRVGISMPEVGNQLKVYDNGTVQIYHRRPITPYQR